MATLTLDAPPYLNRSLGSKSFGAFNETVILVLGDQTSTMSTEKLYKLDGTSFYFKFNSMLFDTNSGYTFLSFWQSVDGEVGPAPGAYDVEEYFYEKLPLYGRKICMLGDSITGGIYGSHLRALLRAEGLKYDFDGITIDTFGYRCNWVGGSNTAQYLDSLMQYIPTCDSYNVLLGSADDPIGTPTDTVSNLIKICKYLHARNPEAEINLCTLVLRSLTARNLEVNDLLRKTHGLKNVHLLDLERALPSWDVWQNYLFDGVHPTVEGYTDYIAPALAELIV